MEQTSPYRSRPREEVLAAVKRRGRRLRRRHRFFFLAPPLIAVLAVTATALAVGRDDEHVVAADRETTTSTRPPGTTTTRPPGTSSTAGPGVNGGPTTIGPPPTTIPGPTTTVPGPGTTTTTAPQPPAGLVTRIELSSTVVVAGGTLTGQLVVNNEADTPALLLDGECQPKWTVYLAPGMPPAFPSICSGGALVFPPGVTRLPFSLKATLTSCSQAEPPNAGLPPCEPPPDVMPPLEPGDYRATLHTTADALTAAPVPVEVVGR